MSPAQRSPPTAWPDGTALCRTERQPLALPVWLSFSEVNET